MKVTSTAFKEGDAIPAKYTCDGEDVSPPLHWSGTPPGTRSLALICDDPDAPGKTWVHWVIYNLSPKATGLSEHITPDSLPDGAKQGLNDFKRIGYGGPCPPGGTHRYYFRIYALDTETPLREGATKEELMTAMASHILAKAELMGTYKR